MGSSGEVRLDDDIIITVPSGTASLELQITIEKLSETSKLLTDQETLVSQIFEVLANIENPFDKPISISLQFDPGKAGEDQKIAIFYYDEQDRRWVEVGGEVSGNWITAEIDHFTKFAVLAIDMNEEDSAAKPEQPEITFADIAGHWGERLITEAVKRKLINGYQDGSFKPNNPITRAEFTVMLANALQLQGTSADLNFTDQANIGSWAKPSIELAVHGGLVNGYNDGSFRPDALITRAEMSVMISRALGAGLDGSSQTQFADDKDIPHWAKGAVEAIRKLGIIQGRGGNQFAPNESATRAEAVVMLLRMMENREVL